MAELWATWVPVVVSVAALLMTVRGAIREMVRESRKELTERADKAEAECERLAADNERLMRILSGLRANGEGKG